MLQILITVCLMVEVATTHKRLLAAIGIMNIQIKLFITMHCLLEETDKATVQIIPVQVFILMI